MDHQQQVITEKLTSDAYFHGQLKNLNKACSTIGIEHQSHPHWSPNYLVNKMDCANVKAEFGTTDYYLNRLIQRALVEPKPILKIYEEECQRLPDISLTVTFKNFQSALHKHRMNFMARQHAAAASQLKQHELNRINKSNNARFSPLGDFNDHNRRARKHDIVAPPQTSKKGPNFAERYNPQIQMPCKNGFQPPEATYTATTRQQPVEEETAPEFIEMSTNPPLLTDTSKFPGLGVGPVQLTSDQSVVPIVSVSSKSEVESGKAVDGAVQSSSPLNNNSLLAAEHTSPLNVRCVKCITALVTCAVMPCGHCCLCTICGQTVLSLKQVCPVCRKSINTVIGYSNIIYNVYR